MNVKSNIETAQVLFPSACMLGESPMWHAERNSCFWVDIERCRIYEYSWINSLIKKYDLKQRISLVVAGKQALIVGLQGGVFRFNLDTQELSIVTELDENWTTHRCNDGICDNRGRLWISTMELNHLAQKGSVYCVSEYGLPKKCIEHATIPNGMAWSRDGKQLYYIDSTNQSVKSYLYDSKSGAISSKKIALLIPPHMGIPDGMTIDEQGMLWIAFWGGYGVGRFDVQSGKMVGFIDIPAPYVTSCVFAGKDLDYLIITTAIADMKPTALLEFPESGHTFVIRPGVKGTPDNICTL
jgi:sugar lactone lactonase YvrE